MKSFIGLTKRNLLIYFKDMQSVIFSLLTSIIVLALYLLFLKNNYVDMITSTLGVLDQFIDKKDCDALVNGILLTGVLGSAMITVPYNCLSTIIKDKEDKIDYDICATPLKRWQIILSYFVSSALSAIIMTTIILTVGLVVISSMGKTYLTAEMTLAAYGIIILGSISATAFFMIIILFFKSTSASGAFFGMLSAASGFVIGAFIPISEFSEKVQTVCNLFPASHITCLMRNVLLNGVIDHMNDSIGGIDDGIFAKTIKEVFTFKAHLFDTDFAQSQMVMYSVVITIACVFVMMLAYSKTYKRK